MGRKHKAGAGDVVTAPGALEKQIEQGNMAKQRAVPRAKAKRTREEKEPEFVPAKLSSKILLRAREQLDEEREEDGTHKELPESSNTKRMRHVSLGAKSQDSDDDDDQEEVVSDADDYVEAEVALDVRDEMELQRFMVKKGETKTLYDLIQEKIDKKEWVAKDLISVSGDGDMQVRDLDPEIVEMYREVGLVMAKYRSGKVPKAFKYIPKMINWEQILYLTDPDGWSAAAMYEATRLFASNMNPRMCQRFYNLVLLPRLRDDIDEFKKLNFHLYQALMKSIYKPAAFFKGIILPLCESGTCTLREAVIFSSVIQRRAIPIFHAAAAMLKIAEMDYTGASSMFLRTLIDKKYALPYRAIDAVCNHYLRFSNDDRELPVLWHQCLLAFVQRYKKELNEEQREALGGLLKKHYHYQITPEVRRELQHAGDVPAPDEAVAASNEDVLMSGEGQEAAVGAKVVESTAHRTDTMEF